MPTPLPTDTTAQSPMGVLPAIVALCVVGIFGALGGRKKF